MSEPDPTKSDPTRIPPAAAFLGYFGAVPFVFLAGAAWLVDMHDQFLVLFSLVTYGAVILSFMGGVRWGLAMLNRQGPTLLPLTVSVTPALLGWLAVVLLFVIHTLGAYLQWAVPLLILAVSFLGLFWSDVRATAQGHAPAWYPRLRVRLTGAVVFSLLLALARIVTGPPLPIA